VPPNLLFHPVSDIGKTLAGVTYCKVVHPASQDRIDHFDHLAYAQPGRNAGGSLTQNGLFQEAVQRYKEGTAPPERVRVYEKIRSGIWVYNGLFELVDCWTEQSGGRKVFKIKLQFSASDDCDRPIIAPPTLEDDRLIPSWVKLEVWKRDQGRCRKCGTSSGLHFDHIIPYSKGGSSKDPANIQVLCGIHNLSKRDNIE